MKFYIKYDNVFKEVLEAAIIISSTMEDGSQWSAYVTSPRELCPCVDSTMLMLTQAQITYCTQCTLMPIDHHVENGDPINERFHYLLYYTVVRSRSRKLLQQGCQV